MKPQRNNRKPELNQSAKDSENICRICRIVILSGLVVWENDASVRKSATMNATGGFIIDVQTSIMKIQM